ncbi:MAG: hypothetical protein IKV35_01060 [Clostridia bacterium]|nr:hypothetical protein [Clostridia bacterium]
MKKILSIGLSMMLLVGLLAVAGVAPAAQAANEVEGVRWFPCRPDRQNDELWEAECASAALCQPFDHTAADTGYTNYLSTSYGADGSLTLRRTGADGHSVYWPRVRTLTAEGYPAFDLTSVNTLRFNITATDCSWNVWLNFNGLYVSLGHEMAKACGMAPVDGSSDVDIPAGTYVGAVNLREAIANIAAEQTTGTASNASAILNSKKYQVPQLTIFYVGEMGGSLTFRELALTTASDTAGTKCTYADMEMLYPGYYGEEEPSLPPLIFDNGIYYVERVDADGNYVYDENGNIVLDIVEVGDDGQPILDENGQYVTTPTTAATTSTTKANDDDDDDKPKSAKRGGNSFFEDLLENVAALILFSVGGFLLFVGFVLILIGAIVNAKRKKANKQR